MGKNRFMDHRRPPKSAGIPQILRGGQKVPYEPEPEIPTDEIVQLRRETVRQRGEIEELERKLRVATAQLKGIKQQLQDARDETRYLRHQQQQPELEGQVPNRIEIVTVDAIQRQNETATMLVLADIDGTMGETNVVMPIPQLKRIIKRKQKEQHERRENQPAAGLPEVRRTDKTVDLPDRVDVGAEAGGGPLR